MALIDRSIWLGLLRLAPHGAWLATQGHPVNAAGPATNAADRLVAVYQRPNTSKPAAAHKVYPYLLVGCRSIGQPGLVLGHHSISDGQGVRVMVAIMDGTVVRFWPGGCETRSAPISASSRWRTPSHGYGKPEVSHRSRLPVHWHRVHRCARACGITISMDGKGRCMDNIFIDGCGAA